MKRILAILCAVASLSFADLRVDTQEKKVDIGFFIGGGLGVGANAMTYHMVPNPNGGLYAEDQSFASFVASVKLGAYHYFTPMIGLRAYYNLDMNIVPMNEYSNSSGKYSDYIFSTSHTLNADAIINVFAYNNIDVAVITGLGLGALVGEYNLKNETVYTTESKFLDFEFRLNIGARAMFNKKYGVEFMAKIPVTPATRINGDNTSNIKYSPYYFTVDFVMERF